jgi:hypothetical protein
MKKLLMSAGLGTALAFAATAGFAHDDGKFEIFAIMKPANEVPSISSVASATMTATVDENAQTITFELKYANLEAPPTQAHIHFGQFFANGGVSVFFCANPDATSVPPVVAPPGTQPCPLTSPATVTGTLTAANIIGPGGQGITAGQFAELAKALKTGDAYANVHSKTFPGGEARGQIFVSHR